MNISVFCSSQTKPGDPTYEEGTRLGRLLAIAGHNVLTGGYTGLMEAVSRGASEAGGHVIGVTCAEVEAWRPGRANPWVQEERHYATMRERMYALIEGCDAAFALPGGVGTLAEVAVLWSHLLTGAIPPRPLVLIGPGWQETLETFWKVHDAYVPEKYRRLLTFAQNVDIAVGYI